MYITQSLNGFIRNSALLIVCCFIVSCSSVPQEETIAEKTMSEVLVNEKVRVSSQVPDAVSGALMDGALGNAPVSRKQEERFDISVNNIPAKTFFMSLVADSGVNVVAHPEISGLISLELKDVTVSETLDVTREVYGYEYNFQNNIYTIYPRKLRTEVFPINYIDVRRVGVSDTGVMIGEIVSDGNGSGGSGNNNSGGDSRVGGNSQGVNLLGYADSDKENGGDASGLTPGARVQTLNVTNFWYSINKTISSIIGGGENGRMVMTNPQAGLVVVTALPRELSVVRDFLQKSELSVKRQVVLETKIIEVRLNEGFEAGINWGAISGYLSASSVSTGAGTFDDIVFEGDGTNETTFSSVLEVVDITKLLKLLETQGQVQVLSSPRISTVNNQKALIRVGSDEFFVTGIEGNQIVTASTVSSAPEILFQSFFSGIALDVTPQIAENNEIILHIHPIVSDVVNQNKEVNISGDTFSFPLALRDVRESDSIVRAKSGQVVVLGGLMQETTSDVEKKRPFIGDIPGLNLFFKYRGKSTVKTELVILMRPIVMDDASWQDEISKRADNIIKLSDEYRSR